MSYKIRPRPHVGKKMRKCFYRRLASSALMDSGYSSMTRYVEQRVSVVVNNLDWAMNLIHLPGSFDHYGQDRLRR